MLKNVNKADFDLFLDVYSKKMVKSERNLSEDINLTEYSLDSIVIANHVELKTMDKNEDTYSVDSIWLENAKNSKQNLANVELSATYKEFIESKDALLRFEEELKIYDDVVIYSDRWNRKMGGLTIREKAEKYSGLKGDLTKMEEDTWFRSETTPDTMDYEKNHKELLDLIQKTELELNEARVIIESTPTIEDKLNYVCTHPVKENIYLDNSNYYKSIINYLTKLVDNHLAQNKYKYMKVLVGTYPTNPSKIAINVVDKSKHTKVSPVIFYIEDKQITVNRSLFAKLPKIDIDQKIVKFRTELEGLSKTLIDLQTELNSLSHFKKLLSDDKRIQTEINDCYYDIYGIYESILYYTELLKEVDSNLEDKSLRLVDVLNEQQEVLNFLCSLTKTEVTYKEGITVEYLKH